MNKEFMISSVWCSDWLTIWKNSQILPLIYTKFRSIGLNIKLLKIKP